MKQYNFFLTYALLVLIQMVICNYFHLSSYVLLSILPVMVLCIPIRISTPATLCVAFVTGFLVDLLSEGLLGINTLSIVPVAFLRKVIIQLVFGEEVFARNEDFSIKKSGLGKVSIALLIAQGLFLVVYILADGAGTRPFSFNLLRFVLSLAAGYAVSILLVDTLAPDSSRK